jgi:putative ATP-dependent endonuclease of the OLD family
MRLRTLADRRGLQDKTFTAIKQHAGAELRDLILTAALGTVPSDKTLEKSERKTYHAHSQTWFKTVAGGRELEAKVFALSVWPTFRPLLLPFCNAVRTALQLPEIQDLS